MKQATSLYGSTDSNEPEAIGTAITMMKDDLRGIPNYTVFQVVVMGDPGAYSVEFTLHFSDDAEPAFPKADDDEVLA